MRMFRMLVIMVVLLLPPVSAYAVEPDEILPDPVLEARARDISKKLRCVVCQNQDIDSSNAGVARDLRLMVRERLIEGDNDKEVLDFIRARYGDFVLLNPPFQPKTAVLWLTPAAFAVVVLLAGAIILVRHRSKPGADVLSAEEEAEVREFVKAQQAGNRT